MAIFEKRYHPPGTAPGTLTEVPVAEAVPLRIRLINYSADQIVVRDDVGASECQLYLQKESFTWVHVQGHPSEAALQQLGTAFQLHTLALEDVLNSGQRPKVESFADQLFIAMSLPLIKADTVSIEQVSIFLGKKFLISFCVGDVAS
ncbi:MAG: CorA family divalent cation transporter, partial [Gammaproteobacteria bacterium]